MAGFVGTWFKGYWARVIGTLVRTDFLEMLIYSAKMFDYLYFITSYGALVQLRASVGSTENAIPSVCFGCINLRNVKSTSLLVYFIFHQQNERKNLSAGDSFVFEVFVSQQEQTKKRRQHH